MKKLVALLLVLVMAVSLFAACKGGEGAGTTAPAGTKAPAGTQAPAGTNAPAGTTAPAELNTDWIWEDKTISGKVTFAMPFKGPAGMDAMIAEFNESYPNIEVELHVYSNNSAGNVALDTAISGGLIDVVTSFGLSNAYNRWSGGLYMDLTDMVEEEGIDLVANWGTDVYKYEDSVYTFPCGGLSYYIAINMTAWKDAGYTDLPTEWTWDEYIEACTKMTKKNADGTTAIYGGGDYHSQNYVMNAYLQVNGGDMYYTKDGKSSFDDPLVIKQINREIKAEKDGIWYAKANRLNDWQAQMTFCRGTQASVIICNVTRFLHDTATYPEVDWITGFAPYPVEEKGQTNYMSGVTPFSHAGITYNCDDVDAAWAFLKWYSTYGVKYLVASGHQPNWTGTEIGSAIEVIYGSEEEAKKWIDIESYNRVVGVATNPMWKDVVLTAYGDMSGICSDYVMKALTGEMTAEDAMAQAAQEANDAIANAG